MTRRYIISKNKRSNWFTDLFKSKDSKMLDQLVKELRKKGLNADKKKMKVNQKNGQKFVDVDGQIFILTENMNELTNNQDKKIQDFIVNLLKSLKIENAINVLSLPDIKTQLANYINGLQKIQLSNGITLVKIS